MIKCMGVGVTEEKEFLLFNFKISHEPINFRDINEIQKHFENTYGCKLELFVFEIIKKERRG